MGMMELPEECIALILSLTTPADVKRLAAVSKAFEEAAKSDLVWRRFLSRRLPEILGQDHYLCAGNSPLREVFDRLCDGVHHDDHKQIYMVDAATGGVIRMISARALTIIWGDDDRYWDWRNDAYSRFEEVAYLKLVWWLELGGKIKGFWPRGNYTVSLRLKLSDQGYVRRHFPILRPILRYQTLNGWNHKPAIFRLEDANEGEIRRSACYLDGSGRGEVEGKLTVELVPGEDSMVTVEVTRVRDCGDGWKEYDVGEFRVEEDGEDEVVDVRFAFQEIISGQSKSGLSVDGLIIRPSTLVCRATVSSPSV